MPTKTRMELIADAIDARLALIQTGTGSNFTIGYHGIGRFMPEWVPDLPAVFIARMSMGERENALTGSTSAKLREAVATYLLTLHVANEDADAQLRLLARDVVRAIEGDPLNLGLATYVLDVITTAFEPDDAEREMEKPYFSGVLTLAVRYRMARGEF
jgi:hypothetical protein